MEVVRREGKPLSIHGVATEGPLILQEGAVVAAGATLRGPVFLAAGSRIAKGCSVSNACIYEGTTIDADATQMRQLIQNLIGNALKFRDLTKPPVVRLEAEKEAHGDRFRLMVRDNGIGFETMRGFAGATAATSRSASRARTRRRVARRARWSG